MKKENIEEAFTNDLTALTEQSESDIQEIIHTIREKQVILDFDLAHIYGYEVKALNQQVKRNIRRFPDDFMFQLTKEEINLVKSQIVTSRDNTHHSMLII